LGFDAYLLLPVAQNASSHPLSAEIVRQKQKPPSSSAAATSLLNIKFTGSFFNRFRVQVEANPASLLLSRHRVVQLFARPGHRPTTLQRPKDEPFPVCGCRRELQKSTVARLFGAMRAAR
jgi:hypothetical protein